MAGTPQQFITLDALRGVAAIGVMIFHAPVIGPAMSPGGYLAVDLFFWMSGFVIAQSYGHRLAIGMTPREFLGRRAVRLWPMLALGALLGITFLGGHAGSLILLPNPQAAGLFPANPPLWSLLVEGLAYAAFAFGMWKSGPRALAGIMAISGGLLVWMAMDHGLIVDFGARWSTFAGGLARIGFGFAGGMLAWHLWSRRSQTPRKTWLAWLPLAAMAAIMAGVPQYGGPQVVVAAVIGCPMVLWAAVRWQLPQGKLAKSLGDLSYPLYCIHAPLLLAGGYGPMRLTLALPLFVALPIAALLLHHWIDLPIRQWLANRFLPAAIRPASA